MPTAKFRNRLGVFESSKIKQKQSLLKMFDIRRNQKDSKGTTKEQNAPKESQAEPRKIHKFNQKGARQKNNN